MVTRIGGSVAKRPHGHVCRNECSRPRIRNQLWRKYKIETKGVAVVIEELKQCISAKAHKIKGYNDLILQYQQNRLFVHIRTSVLHIL